MSRKMSAQLAFILICISSVIATTAFSPPIKYTFRSRTFGALFYKEGDENESSSTEAHLQRLSVPLIGPLPNSSPLIVGGEMSLNHPTPLQWSSLEESVIIHMERNKGTGETAIDGAPIVAVIDEISKMEPSIVSGALNRPKTKGRYATLAAVIGIRSSGALGSNPGESFMESVARMKESGDDLSADMYVSGSVRLIGIGRAVLGSLYYKVPSQVEEDEDDADDDDEYAEKMPIIMAEFKVLHDTGVRSDSEWRYGQRSRFVSPVHAISQLNTAANKAEWLHTERKQLVAGLNAAKARLRNAKLKSEEVLEDYDGLGMLADLDDMECDTEACEDVDMAINQILSILDDPVKHTKSFSELQQDTTSPSEALAKMDNYGLTYFSGFSRLAELTDEALKSLDPYYSPTFKDREEYWFEVFGFVVWRALEGFVNPEEVAWALKCKSSIDRLERACELLKQHRELLQYLASEVSEELTDCGEECTDLW